MLIKCFYMDMRHFLLFFCTYLFTNLSFGQKDKVFLYSEYSENYDHTYIVLAQYKNSEANKKGQVIIRINGYKGQAKDKNSVEQLNEAMIAETIIKLKVNAIKSDKSMNEDYNDVVDRATYTLNTSLDTIENTIPAKESSDMGNFQILWALVAEFNINNGIMLATLGNDSVMLKAIKGLNIENSSIEPSSNWEEYTSNKSQGDGEKYLSEYGTMHFLFEEVDNLSKPNQYNKIVARISETSPNNFTMKMHYTVWKAKTKNKLKEKMAEAIMKFKITNIDMSSYEDDNIAKLTVELDKDNSTLVQQVGDDYEGYFVNFTLALTDNKEWFIDVARGIYFLVDGNEDNNVVFIRDYNTNNFLND